MANSNTSASADQRTDARRSDQLDAGAVGRVSGVGTVARGLSAEEKVGSVSTASGSDRINRGERDEESYVIDAGLKLLRLLECVEGKNFEPVTIKRLMDRTGFNRSSVRSLVITAKRARWLKEIVAGKERQFIPGPKLDNLAKSYAIALTRSAGADRNGLFS